MLKNISNLLKQCLELRTFMQRAKQYMLNKVLNLIINRPYNFVFWLDDEFLSITLGVCKKKIRSGSIPTRPPPPPPPPFFFFLFFGGVFF